MLKIVPPGEKEPLPSLGDQVCAFLEERACHGPGSLKGQPLQMDCDFRYALYRLYEVWPQGHPRAGRRRFQRGSVSLRKGSAKCLDADVLLTFADGSRRRAADCRPGDEILSWDDSTGIRPARVRFVATQPPVPRYRVTTEHGRSLVVTGDHPFLVQGTRWVPGMPKRRRYPSCDPEADRYQWVKAAELRAKDRLLVATRWALEVDGALDAETAWLLGAIIGDGSGDGRFTNVDSEVLDKMRQRFELAPLTGDPNSYYLRGSRPLLRQHGLFGCNAHTKRVPAEVFTAGRATIGAFLAGYLDTDGCVIVRELGRGKIQTSVQWASVNRPLLEDCQHLLTGLGVNASLREWRTRYKGRPHVSLALTVNDSAQLGVLAEALPLVHNGKRERLEWIAARQKRCVFAGMDNDRVVSVEQLADGETVAIEVDETNTHVTAGLVTHNTELLALVAFAELHPDSPVRFAGFNRDGSLAQGRPVANPYIPLLANTQEQVAELAFGALMTICEEGADPECFDVGMDRILRLGERGEADGKALPLSAAPNARDGARTTFQGLDEPHRLYLPNHKAAVETMLANLPKRAPEDPWQLTTTTAGELGQGSVAEDEFHEAEQIDRGLVERPSFFFLHRQASDGYDMAQYDQRVAAVTEASGPDVRKWSDVETIAAQWDRPGADTAYLERVWCNRWVRSASQAFDVARWRVLALTGERIPRRAWVTLGFDGARFRDSTAFVMTDVKTGFQELVGLWERPPDAPEDWEVPESEVTEKFHELMRDYRVLKLYADPPHWTNTLGEWSVRHPDVVEEWWTNRRRPMFRALRAYREAMATGRVSHNGDPDLERHLGNAGRAQTTLWDDDEETGTQQRVWILCKLHPERKIDAAMAAALSWQARLDNLGNIPKRKRGVVARIR